MSDVPNSALAEFLKGTFNLTSGGDTLRIALFDNSTAYTFDPDAHDFVDDVLDGGTTAQEFNGSAGYTGSSDRKTLSGQSVTVDDTDDEGVWDVDDVTWTNVSAKSSPATGEDEIQGWLVYQQIGGDDSTPGDDRLILVEDDDMSSADADLPLSTNGSDIVIAVDAEGLLNDTT